MTHSALVLVPENRFAHAAAVRLLDRSAAAVPIVTLIGPSGVGKSQMVRHIARQAVKENANIRLAHLTAAELSLELAKASDAGMVREFQETYRRQQLFICEDLQAIERRKETQTQLLAIIDEVVVNRGRVLLSCHRPPGELKGLCPKLVNRCHGGVCADIEMPQPGTRAIFLQEFAEGRGVALKDHWVQKLAKRIDGTPRELMGAIIQLEILAGSRGTTIDDAVVSEFVSQLHQSASLTLAEITKAVGREFDASSKEIRGSGRGQAIVIPRHIAMYIARKGGGHRYTEIGAYYGNRSHSTVLHACQQVIGRMETETQFRQQVQHICDGLKLSHTIECRQLVDDM